MTSRRSVLLPPYLANNPAWQQLVEAIDEVLLAEVDTPTDLLQKLRDNWILGDTALPTIEDRELLAPNQFFSLERETLIRQANLLGFLFKESDLLSDDDYRRLVRNLGSYWFGKGTPKFADFLAFCLNSALRVVKLWSTQGPTYDSYGPMLEEGDAGVGTPNHQGGEWFETNHVHLIADPARFKSTEVSKLIALFNTLANYDLVLDAVVFEDTTMIHTPGDDIAVTTQAYPMVDIATTIYTVTVKAPTANLVWESNEGSRQLVHFFDMSTNAPTSWLWDFGDVSIPTSTEQNPIVVFAEGVYSITLTVSNAFGSSTITKVISINAAPSLLLEDGSYMLLETSGHILLE